MQIPLATDQDDVVRGIWLRNLNSNEHEHFAEKRMLFLAA